MPGIYGAVDLVHDSLDITKDFGKVMVHEPWYIHDKWQGNHAVLGCIHTGILCTEKQPAKIREGKLQLVLHGYIVDLDYHINWLEKNGCIPSIRWSPSLVAVHLYNKIGNKFIDRLNGSFAIAVWDQINGQLSLFTDRFGTRPIYYTCDEHKLLFSSEVKCILQDSKVNRGIDIKSVSSLLTFGTVICDQTLFKAIKKVPAGSQVLYNGNGISKMKYWDIVYKEDATQVSIPDYANEMGVLLEKAVSRCLQTNSKVGLALSGGLDSRYVGGYLGRMYEGSLHTYSFGRKGCPDLSYAAKVAKVLGSQHHKFITAGEYVYKNSQDSLLLTDCMLDLFDTQASIINQEAKKEDVDVIWTGFIGDVIWGGSFLTESMINRRIKDHQFAEEVHDSFAFFMPSSVQKQLFRPKIWSQIEGSTLDSIDRILAECKASDPANRADYVFLRTRMQNFTLMANLMLFTKNFDYQIPTIDNDLLDFSLGLPPKMRFNYNIYLTAVRKQFPELSKIPWTKTGLPLSMSKTRQEIARFSTKCENSLRYRIKRYSRGKIMIPYRNMDWHCLDNWSRTVLKSYIESILLSESCLSRPFINPDALKQLISDHMNNKIDVTFMLSPLLTLELWHQVYLD